MIESTLFDAQLRSRFSDPDTSRAAADSIRPALGAECARVLTVIESCTGGATAADIRYWLAQWGADRDQNCIARRCTDLRDAGLIVDSGVRRLGRSGRKLIVWTAVQS